MSGELYSLDVLRMAAGVAEYPPLGEGSLREDRRSPTCGSRMSITLMTDENGLVSAIGLDAKACALGQAAAAIMARGAIGRSGDDLAKVSESWRAYLEGQTELLPDWPDLALLAAGRAYPARHPSMRLAFEAASAALARSPTPTTDHG